MKTLEELGISPAPWKCWIDTHSMSVVSPDFNVAETYDMDCHDKENACQANTRLIAAAPELYEALRLCVGEMCKYCKDTEIGKRLPCENGCEVLRMARAALEKAGGEK